jgi:hypothetical protein
MTAWLPYAFKPLQWEIRVSCKKPVLLIEKGPMLPCPFVIDIALFAFQYQQKSLSFVFFPNEESVPICIER